MILKLLTNANYFIYYLIILFVFMFIAYLIYKIFIIENDLYYLNQKINKIEIEFSNPNGLSNNEVDNKQENFNMNEIIMNEIFNSEQRQNNLNQGYCDINGVCHVNAANIKVKKEEVENTIDIDNIINDICQDDNKNKNKTNHDDNNDNNNDNNDNNDKNNDNIFDLKKEILNDDKESIISSNNITKKKLQKLNLDKLKEKCLELNISSEGSKAQIIDRIIESS